MKSALRCFTLGLSLLLPLSAAHAQVSVSPISNKTLNAGGTLTVNVVAVDPAGGAITLTSSLPAFAHLNAPTTGTGTVATTLTIAPGAGDVGDFDASVTATVGEQSDTEPFHITVAAAETNQPPRVTAPALETVTEGSLLSFTVTASDPDQDAITSLYLANGQTTGATFTVNGTYTEGVFNWTPDLTQAGEYDVVFAASNTLSDSATTHISVANLDHPVKLATIPDVTLAEKDTVHVDVTASDPDKEAISLTASLPSFATLDAPTSSADQETLKTTITIIPPPGSAGEYAAWVKATAGETAATDSFMITVTAGGGGGAPTAQASLIGNFNHHKKRICFKVTPVDNSFDLRDVSLSSITLNFQGRSIHAVRPTHLAFDCGDDEGDNDQGEDGDGGEGHDGHDDAGSLASLHRAGADCDDCEDDDGEGDDGDRDTTGCVPSHIMACFATSEIDTLFGDAELPGALANATIEGDLNDGQSFVATIGPRRPGNDHWDNDATGKGRMHLQIRPNPMNPKADILFSMSKAGKVRVAIYDIRGRLVATLHDGEVAAGAQSIPWDGSSRSRGHVASGRYFVKVETPNETQVQAITVVK